jgi:hypothetical protein
VEELVKLKRLRIKKDLLRITIKEKKEAKTKSLIFLVIFLALLVTSGILLAQGGHPETLDERSALAGKFTKFLAGKSLLATLLLLFWVYAVKKEIRGLEKEYELMKEEVRYLSN